VVAAAPAAPAAAPTGGTVDDPVIGVAYPFQMPTHCGIQAASFGGHWWLATAPTGTSGPVGPQYTAGTMTLVSPSDARFDYAGGTAEFTPTATPQPCQ
jgi:hypothetical protein